MSKALQTIQTVKPATTDLALRLGLLIFVRGPLRPHVDALEDLWVRLQSGLLRRRFTRYRLGSDTAWTALPESSKSSFAEVFEMRSPLVGRWGLELAADGDPGSIEQEGPVLQLSDLAPVRGMERASHLRVLFPDETSIGTVAALGQWAINRLPFWWGAAGFVFHHTSGTMFTAHTRMAALAKRYWGVQIQDMGALQWDALRGMPGVNWLTLVGNEFARARDMSVEGLGDDEASLKTEGVFQRRGLHGVALAAGKTPLRGDINVGEDLDAYVRIGRRIQPLLLTEHTPLFGPFCRPEVMGAWLGRFSAPQAWLECDIRNE